MSKSIKYIELIISTYRLKKIKNKKLKFIKIQKMSASSLNCLGL